MPMFKLASAPSSHVLLFITVLRHVTIYNILLHYNSYGEKYNNQLNMDFHTWGWHSFSTNGSSFTSDSLSASLFIAMLSCSSTIIETVYRTRWLQVAKENIKTGFNIFVMFILAYTSRIGRSNLAADSIQFEQTKLKILVLLVDFLQLNLESMFALLKASQLQSGHL